MQPPGCISPVRGVVERFLELVRKLLEVGGQLRVVPHRCHGLVQGPVGEGRDDEGYLGPFRLEPGGLVEEKELALPQE